MTVLLADMMGLAADLLIVGGAVFLRVGAMTAVLPAFGERSVPMRVRLVITLALTVIVAPAVTARVSDGLSAAPGYLFVLGGEVLAGLCLGIGLRLFVLALQTAGAMAAQATSLAQIFGNMIVDPQPAIAQIMIVAGLALAVILGLHVKVVEVLILSYQAFPVGRLPGAEEVMVWGVAQVAAMFTLAFTLAAPFVIIALLYNLSLGAINRAMPQLMVSFVGAPAITLGAMVLLAVSLPFLLAIWVASMDAFIANPFGGF